VILEPADPCGHRPTVHNLLGQLTADIAREIKNPLNFVNNFSAVSIELINELRKPLARLRSRSRLDYLPRNFASLLVAIAAFF
jgi:signal transduction histidine kinase